MKTILAAGFASFLLTTPSWCSEEIYNDLLFKAKAYADRCTTRIIRPSFEEVCETCEKAMDRKFNDKQITEEELLRLKKEFRMYFARSYYAGPTEPEPKPNPTTVLNEIYDFASKRAQENPRPPMLEVFEAGKDKANTTAKNGKITYAQYSDFEWNYWRWLKNIYARPQIIPARPAPALPPEEYATLEIQRQQDEIQEMQRKMKAEMERQRRQIEDANFQREQEMMRLRQEMEREKWRNQYR